MSCKKENLQQSSNSNDGLQPLTAQRTSLHIGVIHNDALVYCYDYLKTMDSAYQLSLDDKMSIIQTKIAEYLASNNPYNINITTINDFYEESPFTISSGINYLNTSQSQRIATLLSNYTGSKKDLISSVFTAVDASETIDELRTKLDSIETQLNVLSDNDANEVRSFMSVAENSWIYWVEDSGIDNWKQIFKDPSLAERSRPDIAKAAIKGDIEGAVTGALTGAGFAGVGALAGAMIGAPVMSGWSALWAAF